MLKKNDIIRLEITGLTSVGSGVGRYMDFVVFVSKSAPGDIIDCRIIKTNKSYAIGKIEKIIKPSECRIEPDCKAFKSCGGCSFRHIDYNEELRQKLMWVNADLQKNAHIDFKAEKIVGATDTLRYRNKAQYPVTIKDNQFITGFYAFKSHRIIECRDCLLHPKEFSTITNVFEKWAIRSKVTCYDENTNTGLLRHIYLRKAFGSNEIMVIAVINGNEIPNEKELIDNLLQSEPSIRSIGININNKNTNTILGKETHILWGEDKITDKLLGKSFIISPESFYQVNHDMCELLYSKIKEYANVKKSDTVLDLYCGTGTIGLTLSDNAKKVVGIEIVSQAIENAKENAKINSINNSTFICADAIDGVNSFREKEQCDVVIVDPPRKGCQKDVLKLICSLSPTRIVYVSCNSATLARDMSILYDEDYRVKDMTVFDLFPRTANVETVCLLSKREVSGHK